MKCILCQSSVDDPLTVGEFIRAENIEVHYFCLLLTPALFQKRDADDDALKGFDKADIVKEARRVGALHCAYCKKRNANIGCCVRKCRHSFHLGCAMAHGCQSEFDGSFTSFCHLHVEDRNGQARHKITDNCGICMEQMGAYSTTMSIWASACCRNGWFHRLCLAEFAASAGYFFKCPLCNNVDNFRNEVLMRGIYVPQKDASWELEENAFAELYIRPKKCDADACICPKGPEFVDDSDEATDWKLLICRGCGSKSTHKRCAGTSSEKFICGFCSGFVNESAIPDSSSSEDDESDDADVDDVEPIPINSRNRKKRMLPVSSEDEDTPVRRVPKRRKSGVRRRNRFSSSDTSDSDESGPSSRLGRVGVTMSVDSVDPTSAYWNPKVVLIRLKDVVAQQGEVATPKKSCPLSQWLKKMPVFQPEKLDAIAFAEVVQLRQISAQKIDQLIDAGRALKSRKLTLFEEREPLSCKEPPTDTMIIRRMQYYDLENVRPGYMSPSKNPQSPVKSGCDRPKPPRFCLSPAKCNELAQSPSVHSSTSSMPRRFATLLESENCAATVTSSTEMSMHAVAAHSDGEDNLIGRDDTWVSSSSETYGTKSAVKSTKRPESPHTEPEKRQKVGGNGTAGSLIVHLSSPSSMRPPSTQKLITNFLHGSSSSDGLSSAEISPRSPLQCVKRKIFRPLKTKTVKMGQGQKTMNDFFRRT